VENFGASPAGISIYLDAADSPNFVPETILSPDCWNMNAPKMGGDE
jgi:hypothetical protein